MSVLHYLQKNMTLESFVSKHLELLELEKEAEVEEHRSLQEHKSTADLQRKGVCLSKLRLSSCCTGLYGRTVCTFEAFWTSKPFPSHNISSGDIVGVGQCDCGGFQRHILASGVVSHVSQNAISVAFDENFDLLGLEENVQYLIIKLANDVTYKRLKRALLNLHKYQGGRASKLIDVLFGDSSPSDPLPDVRNCDGGTLSFFNQNLDTSQQEAVKFALCQKEIALIHGPPGTGKTTTVVEIIMHAVKKGLKVLACAPSNVAVDNLVERLALYKVQIIRLGHPARLLTGIQHYSLDSVLARSEESKIVEDLKKDIDSLKAKMTKTRDKGERQKLWGESKHLSREMKVREKTALKEILRKSSVILSTLTSASEDGPLKQLPSEHFGMVVIDECSQALEAACWIPLLLAPKCVLSGDHLQLPPTIISHKAAEEGLAVTLMERVTKLLGDSVKKMLCIQYRMHNDIMKWPSNQLYDGKLIAHSSVSTHLLRDLIGVQDNEECSMPLLLIDTAGCNLQEVELNDEESKGNEGEANLVAVHVDHIVTSGVRPCDIAVITPYNLQVDLLRFRLSSKYPALEIKSVDGFQGREKEAVILSLVRSNSIGEVGFLSEDRRINVAFTRARRHLAIICDSETISHHAFLKSLMDYMMAAGEVRSAEQYIEEMNKYDVIRPKHLQSIQPVKISSFKGQTKKKLTKDDKNRKKQDTLENKCTFNLNKPTSIEEYDVKESKSEYSSWEQNAREQIQDVIENFLKDTNKETHNFPSFLTSNERRLVHEISEKMGLLHYSQGDGFERYIIIQKRSKEINNDKRTSLYDDTKKSNGHGKITSQCVVTRLSPYEKNRHENICTELAISLDNEINAASPTYVKCTLCQKIIPDQNYKLHTMQCEKKQISITKSQESKSSKKEKSNSPEKDFDTLIAEAVKTDRTCSFGKCKTSLATLGQTCLFCNKRFCFSHFIPEVHGCGDLARAHARSQIKKEGKLYSGSGIPNKNLDPTKKFHLQRKLDKKLSEMSDKRKGKKK